MAGWKLKRGMPEWHQIMTFHDVLRDGTVIDARLEDCDGDVEYWEVSINGVVVAKGECWSEPYGTAQANAERVINYGVAPEVIAEAA